MQMKQLAIAIGLVVTSGAASAYTVNCTQTDGHWSISTNSSARVKALTARCLESSTGVSVSISERQQQLPTLENDAPLRNLGDREEPQRLLFGPDGELLP